MSELTLITPTAHAFVPGDMLAIGGKSFQIVAIKSDTVVKIEVPTRWALWKWRIARAARMVGRPFQRLWWRIVDAVQPLTSGTGSG